MRWPWQWRLCRAQRAQDAAVQQRAQDEMRAEQARVDAERRLQEARRQRPEVRKAATDLAWQIEQSMRRPSQ